jgi:2-polyprenyl-3-methyl-5-hydroxy-6-metoxy-1,4-benzoquinol methylase
MDLDDAVTAYDRVAPEFKRLSGVRQLYLKQVEQVIISEIPAGAKSLLDVGAGDGRRSRRIASASEIKKLVLLEPSSGMRGEALDDAEVWPIRAEQLSDAKGEFDVITCLWNVLGHIHPEGARREVLRQFERLLPRATYMT